MSKEDEAWALGHTPSYLFNNLTTVTDHSAYIHKSDIYVFREGHYNEKARLSTTRLSPSVGGAAFHSVKYAKLDKWILFGLHDSGVDIFSEDGKSVLHSLLSSDIRSDVTEAARMLCIASIPGTKSLFIGWSDGKVTALELAMDVSIPEKKFTEKVSKNPISCIAATEAHLAVGDASGCVKILTNSTLEELTSNAGRGHPATSVAIVGDAAVFGFTTGHIQVYRLLKPSLAIEIAAHTRCITAVDGSSHLHKFLSVGDDALLNVWSLDPTLEKVTLASSIEVTDQILVGGQFTKSGSSHALVAAYDTHKIRVWHLKK